MQICTHDIPNGFSVPKDVCYKYCSHEDYEQVQSVVVFAQAIATSSIERK